MPNSTQQHLRTKTSPSVRLSRRTDRSRMTKPSYARLVCQSDRDACTSLERYGSSLVGLGVGWGMSLYRARCSLRAWASLIIWLVQVIFCQRPRTHTLHCPRQSEHLHRGARARILADRGAHDAHAIGCGSDGIDFARQSRSLDPALADGGCAHLGSKGLHSGCCSRCQRARSR